MFPFFGKVKNLLKALFLFGMMCLLKVSSPLSHIRARVNHMEPFGQRRRIDHTKHKVYISFQTSRRVFVGLSAPTIRSQRKCLFF